MTSEELQKAADYAIDLVDPSASPEQLHAVIKICTSILLAEIYVLKLKSNDSH
jgi:hypothetical protein